MRARVLQVLAAVVLMLGTAQSSSAQSMRETIEATLPRIVKIFGAGGVRNLEAYGTGFLISPEGHVATVWSHVLDREEVIAVLNDGQRLPAKLVGFEPQLDLAILKLEGESLSLPYFDLGQFGQAGPGTRVLGFSNMFKVATGDEPVSVLHGVVAAYSELSARRGAFRVPYAGPVYMVDAITNNSGAAGGALVTSDGVLIGMIGKELRNTESNTWINYAIPISALEPTIRQILDGESPLGGPESVMTAEEAGGYSSLDFGMVLLPDVLHRTPAYIDSVVPGSLAEQVGLRRDDLILFAGEELVSSRRMLEQRLAQLEAGDLLRLVVRRGDELVTVEMPVEKKPVQ
jgi:serine protease Do